MTSANVQPGREQFLIGLIKEITGESLIGDDCAVLPGNRLVSSDMLVEGKHFLLPRTSYEELGWKAMAVNLSDIAAMAGKPEFAIVNIAMPPTLSNESFECLYASLTNCAREHNTRIVGGDLTGSDTLVISITVLGDCSEGYLLRSGAKPGYIVAVTGDFGASALGLKQILAGQTNERSYAVERHLKPSPRLKEANLLLKYAGSQGAALMDASDGLADALLQIARASDIGIELDADSIPINDSVRREAGKLGLNPIDLALYGGEDYELVACISPLIWDELKSDVNANLTKIGTVGSGKGAFAISNGVREALQSGRTYQHWDQ